MGPDASQFSGLAGYLVVLAVILTPIILPFATQAAKRFVGPKSEEVATEAAAKAQQETSALNVELSKALAASLARELELQAEVKRLEGGSGGQPPDPTP